MTDYATTVLPPIPMPVRLAWGWTPAVSPWPPVSWPQTVLKTPGLGSGGGPTPPPTQGQIWPRGVM